MDFHANEALASSLRAERERRGGSWRRATIAANTTEDGQYRMLDAVHNRSSAEVHGRLHRLANVLCRTTVSLERGGTRCSSAPPVKI